MEKRGWLVNDCLTCIPGTKTFWHDLLDWFPKLEDKTGGYTDYSILANVIESLPNRADYIIRNGTYFRKMNTNIPTISLIQDVRNDQMQLDVIRNSNVVVFNTEYVYNKYKEVIPENVIVKISPLGVNFETFKPVLLRNPDVLPKSLLFIGDSSNYPKGFNVMLDIINKSQTQNFCLIMKDNFSINNIPEHNRHRVRVFNRIPHDEVIRIINSCVAAVCTSYEETQHLSGIECAACNIPIIARAVGIYWDNRNNTEWGLIADDSNFVEKIKFVVDNLEKFAPRDFMIGKYSTEVCKNNWKNIINGI